MMRSLAISEIREPWGDLLIARAPWQNTYGFVVNSKTFMDGKFT